VVNDTAEPWTGTVAVARTTLGGEVLASSDLAVDVAPRSVTLVPLPDDVVAVGDAREEVLVASLDGVLTVHPWREDKDLALRRAPVSADVTVVPGGYDVTVTARSLARAVTLLVDRLDPDATVDEQVVDLPAGTSVTFHVRTILDLDPAALTAAPVLRTANDLVAR
jgi:beta-mannosidase